MIVYNDSTEQLTLWVYDPPAQVDWGVNGATYCGLNTCPIFDLDLGQVYVDAVTIAANDAAWFQFPVQAGSEYTLWGHGEWCNIYSFEETLRPILDHYEMHVASGYDEYQGPPPSEGGAFICPSLVSLTNCFLANVGQADGLSGDYNGFCNTPGFGNTRLTCEDSPFAASGIGSCYLKSGSSFRAAGTDSANPALCEALKGKTTQPPIAFPRFTTISGELMLLPQAPRYAGGQPDLGYHYDALDYTMAAFTVNGGKITVQPGTAVGLREDPVPESWWPWQYTSFGIDLLKGSTLISHGTPTRPIVFADVQLVQEQPTTPGVGSLIIGDYLMYFASDDPNPLPPPVMDFRFSNFYVSSDMYQFYAGEGAADGNTWSPSMNLTLRDCNLFGGWFVLGGGQRYYLLDAPCSVSWINNSFDHVKFYLNPDWLDYGTEWMFVDMALEARNNLFCGGALILEPAPASSGNWSFKDNLFDKVDFFQDTGMFTPLDYDYNAYWTLTEAEMNDLLNTGLYPSWLPNASQFQPTYSDDDLNGGNEIVLTSPPAYESGPLDDHYLAASSPLYDADKRGSRSVPDAGLYHYTTCADQTRDADQPGNVIIGRHFVAMDTTGQPPKPPDADNDGVPDYVENWHGDGDGDGVARLHADSETDWRRAETLPGTPDALSTLYDDADLDGDGLVGRVEKVLSKDPLTPDNPLTLTRRTDGSADNIATFVVPLNYDLLAGIGKLKLYVDGAPALLQRCDADTTSGNCLLTWDTTFEAPGAHNVQVALKVTAQTQPSGVGPLTPASIAVREASYQFTLIPGTPEWNTASPSECVASAVIPQSWVDAASTWQLLCSATISPYFRVLWVPGTSITEGYEAVKRTTELSVLNALEARPDLGNNVVRFLSTSDLGSLDGGGCPEGVPCMLDYIVLCQVAGSDAALNSMDLASRERLFSIAAWDVSYLLSHSDRFPAAAPARLMYIIYNKPEAFRGPLSGVTLPALSADQAHLLDIGSLPLELIPDLLDVKTTLGLTCRP